MRNILSTIIIILVLSLMLHGIVIGQSYDVQNWDGWYDDWASWGTVSYGNNGYNDDYTYQWFGQDRVISNNPGSSHYVPEPTYPEQYNGWTSGEWNNNNWNSARWFYQTNPTDPNMGDGYAQQNGTNGYNMANAYLGTLPVAVELTDFVGRSQSLTLDCETRSALDLASYYGVYINHDEFLAALPRSDDPNEGFVGDPNGIRGQLPPASYGVYQEPVAELLNEYGFPCEGTFGMSLDSLKMEIAAGNPVMVWVSGSTEVGYAQEYTPSNGRTTQVVPYQHTVVVIGYNQDNVLIQDGPNRYYRTWPTFEISWGTLNNRAIYPL